MVPRSMWNAVPQFVSVRKDFDRVDFEPDRQYFISFLAGAVHSSTVQLNLSLFCRGIHASTPSASHKKVHALSRQVDAWMSG